MARLRTVEGINWRMSQQERAPRRRNPPSAIRVGFSNSFVPQHIGDQLTHTASTVKAFFAWSDGILDHRVLRPLSHIASNWELSWNAESSEYEAEDDSFATALNRMIIDIAQTPSPRKYHDNEDRLAEYLVAKGWPIRKTGYRWTGDDYDSILEQGGFSDIDQTELLQAATGRIHAALSRGQMHFDDMEETHRRMLGAVLSIILYHRGPDPAS
jgi:hypothetical protein